MDGVPSPASPTKSCVKSTDTFGEILKGHLVLPVPIPPKPPCLSGGVTYFNHKVKTVLQ